MDESVSREIPSGKEGAGLVERGCEGRRLEDRAVATPLSVEDVSVCRGRVKRSKLAPEAVARRKDAMSWFWVSQTPANGTSPQWTRHCGLSGQRRTRAGNGGASHHRQLGTIPVGENEPRGGERDEGDIEKHRAEASTEDGGRWCLWTADSETATPGATVQTRASQKAESAAPSLQPNKSTSLIIANSVELIMQTATSKNGISNESVVPERRALKGSKRKSGDQIIAQTNNGAVPISSQGSKNAYKYMYYQPTRSNPRFKLQPMHQEQDFFGGRRKHCHPPFGAPTGAQTTPPHLFNPD
ncbi:hypothetical protein C8J57DRAFT_1247837 [Mycena rebaudengoi]|nr:hypothetical protein C8J57DRAFT_1247837 [Mycena rebaudengoi]